MSEETSPVQPSALGKAVSVLRAFTIEDSTVSLAELVARTGLHKATVHRIAGELVDLRLLDRREGGYCLSGGLFELGMRAAVERTVLEIAMPFLQDLYERTHETVHLGTAEGHEVVYIAKIGGRQQASSPSRTGGRMPMHCTAIGKVLLAHSPPEIVREVLSGDLERRTPRTITAPGLLRRQLEAVHEQGVAFEREESTTGLLCVAAPVLTSGRPVTLAISVTGPVGRLRPEAHVSAVRAAGAGIGSVLSRNAPRL